MYEIIKFYISGDTEVIGQNLSKEKAEECVKRINKKCNWTEYYKAFEMS